ncbi:Eco57I restriction-modification methylase domain-containing protein [Haliangium ochraceum]|uniref:site-specific DNA-methyltransferase (adenine-specific) n=1 Tax=Haliangium ochraceum (strain DSM 14365 / JCM 11303 / SMP-2) TaxID=502025 RepID=D0LMZ7_HALO1|nr:hypothetical protein [Haliangium ochraceum]ACY13368.1 hypothetical protein Hoch_0744 [Haliangium ochraceum DSM 14365]
MPLSLDDCQFHGAALPEPFVKLELEKHLTASGLLPKRAGAAGKALQRGWEAYRRKLRKLLGHGGGARVRNHVFAPLLEALGYHDLQAEEAVQTREALEDGGWRMSTADGAGLRVWTVDLGTDLDAPARRGHAYRFSPQRIAERVLSERGERIGLLSDGEELRVVLNDPARPGSHITMRLDRSGGWRGTVSAPDSYALLLALASPAGVQAIPALVDKARLYQSEVTDSLRDQARLAVQAFVQELFDQPENLALLRDRLAEDADAVAHQLWRESLVLVYRLLFVFTLEAAPDPARAFSFASTSLWRTTYSPNTALAPHVRKVMDSGAETGRLLEDGLRTLFRMFARGLSSRELHVSEFGGTFFGADATALLDGLRWGERGVARLLDHLLWTPSRRRNERRRVHYGSLDVEDLGRVYEALLELEPGVTGEPMSRLRRQKLEVVVPAAQAARYRSADGKSKGKSKVEFIEDIPADRFYLRAGLGRKSSGSYYTPTAFVRFLVAEALGPQVAERSPTSDPQPLRILDLRVLDPAMGSGHFLVEACRFLGDKLYEACRLCDERASDQERAAGRAKDDTAREAALGRAAAWRERVVELPDPDDELLAYLPSRVAEGGESGLSEKKALALCRRLVAVHCLYGVDKNPLAVGLAKLSLWLEAHAEGLPLTFLDHRLIAGDSLTGPFFEQMLTYPGTGEPLADMHARGLDSALRARLGEALLEVKHLCASVGTDLADIALKQTAKDRLDRALAPFLVLARAWTGGVMLGPGRETTETGEKIVRCDNGAYVALARAVAAGAEVGDGSQAALAPHAGAGARALARMVATGVDAVAYELMFPEVFHPDGALDRRAGFDAVLGNPPWDALQPLAKEFFATYDLRILDAPTRKERREVEARLTADAEVAHAYAAYARGIDQTKSLVARSYQHVNRQAGGAPSGAVTDVWQVFAERAQRLLGRGGRLGLVLPSAFHANQSATGIRALYLDEAALQCCYSFENRFKLFDIDSRFKFATVVTERTDAGTEAFECAFYLHTLDWLETRPDALRYSRAFVRQTGGDYLSFLELRSARDAEVASACYAKGELLGDVMTRGSIRCGEEMHMSKSSHHFTSIDTVLDADEDPRAPEMAARLLEAGYLTLHEGKTFHQYTDCWEERPRYLVHLDEIRDKSAWLTAAQHYRLAFRDIASSTNERTGIFCMLPPGMVCGNKAPCERTPEARPTSQSLALLAQTCSFTFDFVLRLKVQATINLFILNGCPVPALDEARERFLAHAALRLTCNHAGYAPLWREQLGDIWREAGPPQTWPVLADDDARWRVRADIDAVVAAAYGLTRAQYEHVLSSFSHKSYPEARALCLAAFDALSKKGARAFLRARDPYHDIALPDTLPEPVIELPGPDLATPAPQPALDHGPLFQQPHERLPAPAEIEPAPTSMNTQPWRSLTPTDRQMLILCRAVAMHDSRGEPLGRVKAEKIIHLVEALTPVDFERAPVRLAAGPADFPRYHKVKTRAEKLYAFRDVRAPTGPGYRLEPLRGLGKQLDRYDQAFAQELGELNRLLSLLAGLSPRKTELMATLYAVWNDLLADGASPRDKELLDGLYAWHDDKQKFRPKEAEGVLALMRKLALVPTGQARPTPPRAPAQPRKPRKSRKPASPAQSNAGGLVSDVLARLRALLTEQDEITSSDAQAATGLDAAGVRPYLQQLVTDGHATQHGKARGTRYRRTRGD